MQMEEIDTVAGGVVFLAMAGGIESGIKVRNTLRALGSLEAAAVVARAIHLSQDVKIQTRIVTWACAFTINED